MTHQRLSIDLSADGELHFGYRTLGSARRSTRGTTVAELFAAALESFIATQLPPGAVSLNAGNLTVADLSQRHTLQTFVTGRWPEVYSQLGSVFVECALTCQPNAPARLPFFDTAFSTDGTRRQDLRTRAPHVDEMAFWIYERFTVAECCILDLAIESFLRGVRGPRLRRCLHLGPTPVGRRLDVSSVATPRSYVPLIAASNCTAATSAPTDPFRYPSWASGWHSGWTQVQATDPCSSLATSMRCPVGLVPCIVSDTIVFKSDDEVPPFLLKYPHGEIPGLSSGAGGGLVPWGAHVFKFKRCGLAERGILLDAFRDRSISVADRDLRETSVSVPAGLATVSTLETEAEAATLLPKYGLCAASEPAAIHVVLREGGRAYGCLVSRVLSDLRVDEVLFALATGSGRSLRAEERDALVSELGEAEGSLYSLTHRQGLVRGIGNSWFGNEAVAEDGRILLCDLENTFFPEQVPPDLAGFYSNHELNFFEMAVRRSLGRLQHPAARDVADLFLSAFMSAYEASDGYLAIANRCAEWIGQLRRDQPLRRVLKCGATATVAE